MKKDKQDFLSVYVCYLDSPSNVYHVQMSVLFTFTFFVGILLVKMRFHRNMNQSDFFNLSCRILIRILFQKIKMITN